MAPGVVNSWGPTGATPDVIGAAVAWLVTDPGAREQYAGQVVLVVNLASQ